MAGTAVSFPIAAGNAFTGTSAFIEAMRKMLRSTRNWKKGKQILRLVKRKKKAQVVAHMPNRFVGKNQARLLAVFVFQVLSISTLKMLLSIINGQSIIYLVACFS